MTYSLWNPFTCNSRCFTNLYLHTFICEIILFVFTLKDNYQLNYVDVCFEPQPVGSQFIIHGMDKRSEYVDIDFSKSVDILPDNEKMNETDEDFSSVEDIIAMKKDMML